MLAKHLHQAIGDAINFAGAASDTAFAAIAVVHLEVTAERLIAVATNRYVLGITQVPYTGAPFTLTIGIEDAKVLARLAKTAKRDEKWREVEIETGDRQATFRFTTGESKMVRATDTDFPSWRRLIPDTSRHMSLTAGYGYEQTQLARFTKVHREPRDRMVMFGQTKDGRAGATVVHIGDHFVGVIMPARHPSDGEDAYTVPAWLAVEQ
ncbi:hypothetical protein A7R75_30240 [Mycolicibacterium llatzerense]|nr:hypothetical protein [Mycolicibacterium llatzerense]